MIRFDNTDRGCKRSPKVLHFGIFLVLAFVLVLGLLSADQAHAQGEGAPVSPPAALSVPQEQSTPRRLLITFLERMDRDKKGAAAELLDLSEQNAEAAAAKGPELAYKLFVIMQRLVSMPKGQNWPPLDQEEAFKNVPDIADHSGPWSLIELETFAAAEAKYITITRGTDGSWSFSSDTVGMIEELFQATEQKEPVSKPAPDAKTTEPFAVWFERQFPESLRQKYFLLPNYQWFSLILIALLGRFGEGVVRLSMTGISDMLLKRAEPDSKQSTIRIWKPIGRLTNAAIWYVGAFMIGLPLSVVGVLLIVLKFATILAAIIAGFAIIDLVAGYSTRRAKRTEKKFDDLFTPLAVTTSKIILVVVGIIAAVAAFNTELPAALLGGLGIGGVALALASQETLSNFFGSVTVLFDRPFEVGDWILVDGIEGEVESVGFRSTRIRTGLNSQVTFPNNKLAAASVDNWGRRRYRRYLTRIGLEYDTPRPRIDAFCEGIRELIRRQPHTRKDFYAAYFNDFGASALEVLLVCYFEAPDWPTELRERHRLLGDIVELAERLGVAFAFPTQTVHLHQGEAAKSLERIEDPLEAGKQEAAEIAGELLNYQDRPGPVRFSERSKYT